MTKQLRRKFLLWLLTSSLAVVAPATGTARTNAEPETSRKKCGVEPEFQTHRDVNCNFQIAVQAFHNFSDNDFFAFESLNQAVTTLFNAPTKEEYVSTLFYLEDLRARFPETTQAFLDRAQAEWNRRNGEFVVHNLRKEHLDGVKGMASTGAIFLLAGWTMRRELFRGMNLIKGFLPLAGAYVGHKIKGWEYLPPPVALISDKDITQEQELQMAIEADYTDLRNWLIALGVSDLVYYLGVAHSISGLVQRSSAKAGRFAKPLVLAAAAGGIVKVMADIASDEVRYNNLREDFYQKKASFEKSLTAENKTELPDKIKALYQASLRLNYYFNMDLILAEYELLEQMKAKSQAGLDQESVSKALVSTFHGVFDGASKCHSEFQNAILLDANLQFVETGDKDFFEKVLIRSEAPSQIYALRLDRRHRILSNRYQQSIDYGEFLSQEREMIRTRWQADLSDGNPCRHGPSFLMSLEDYFESFKTPLTDHYASLIATQRLVDQARFLNWSHDPEAEERLANFRDLIEKGYL